MEIALEPEMPETRYIAPINTYDRPPRTWPSRLARNWIMALAMPVISINALTKPEGNFWMNPAYRVPVGKFPLRDRFLSQENAASTPITEMVVNSLITSHRDGDKVKAGKVTVSGMAWDDLLHT